MDPSLKKMAKEIVKVTSRSKRNTPQPYDTSGVVKRVENGTAYVIFDGADEETPVSMTINCLPGDNVKIRISDRKAWITGNATAPPTDNRVAYRAINMAEYATREADDVYKKAIDGEFNGSNGRDGENGIDGAPGADAPLVSEIIQYWCLWTSRSSGPDDTATWYDYIPEYETGKYYWTKTVTIYDDYSTVETDPIFDVSAQAGAEAKITTAASQQAAEQARTAAQDSADSAQTASDVAGAVSTELDNLENHFWYDDTTGAHVSENEGSIASGYAFNVTSTNATITKNGKKGVELDSSRLNFYDPANTGNNDKLMASYNNAGAVLYSNGIRASSFTQTDATFWDATDLQNAGTVNQRRFAIFGSSGCNLYYNGYLTANFGNNAINFYDGTANSKVLATYTNSGAELRSNDVRTASFTGSGVTLWDSSDTNEANQRKEAIFSSNGIYLYGIVENSGTYTNPEIASFAANGVTLYDNATQVAHFGSTTVIGQTGYWKNRIELTDSSFKLIQNTNTSLGEQTFFDLEVISNSYSPSLTFGKRESGSTVGLYSAVIGNQCAAVGSASFACGLHTIAYNNQFACGQYNKPETGCFIVGDGDSTERHTAFKIDSSGNTHIYGDTNIYNDLNVSGGITAEGHAYHPIGEISALEEQGTQVLSNSTWETICTLSLTAGTYIVIGTIRWPDTSSTTARVGARIYKFISSSTGEEYKLGKTVIPYRSGICVTTATSIVSLTDRTTILLQGYQSMGGDYPMSNAYIQAVRIV